MANNYFSATRGDPVPCYELSVRTDPQRGGPVAANVRGQEVLARTHCRHLLLLVHGFNNTAQDARRSYQALMTYLGPRLATLRDGPDAVAFFQWPGDAAVLGATKLFDFLGYPVDITRARDTAKVLATCFELLAANYSPATPLRISIIGHSLGCRVVLEALNLVEKRSDRRLQYDVVNLMAAAVPAGFVDGNDTKCNLLPGGQLPRVLIKCYSLWDFVLWLAFPLGESAGVALHSEFASYFRRPEAVGRHGDPDALGRSGDSLKTGHGHSAYWTDQNVTDLFLSRLANRTLELVGTIRTLDHRSLADKVTVPNRELRTRSLPGNSTGCINSR